MQCFSQDKISLPYISLVGRCFNEFKNVIGCYDDRREEILTLGTPEFGAFLIAPNNR